MNFKDKYFGPFLIKESKLSKEVTYFKKPKVILVFEDESEKEIPLKVAEDVITDEKSDFSELREKWTIPIVKDLIEILTESELGNNDLHYALDVKLGQSIKEASDKVQFVLFGKPKEEITLMDFENKFIEYNKKCQKQNKKSN